MLFSTGSNVIDIDIAQTRGFYSMFPYVWQRCQCPVCRNFEERIMGIDKRNLAFLEELGVTASKCPDLWPYEPGGRKGTQKYYLQYPVVCNVVKYSADKLEWLNIENGFDIAIVTEDKTTYLLLDWELEWTHK